MSLFVGRGPWLVTDGAHRVEGYWSGQNGRVRYLSLEWIDALSAAVAASDEMRLAAADHHIAITQVVTGTPDGDVTYHLEVADGRAVVAPGAAAHEDIRMQQDWETAVSVALGNLDAGEALIHGRIGLTGDPQKLMACQPVFKALDAAFNLVRARTIYE